MATVKVYGADWCGMTTGALSHLDRLGVSYEYINVDEDPQASAWVKAQSDGKEKKPTIDIDGDVLVEPSGSQLDAALRRHGAVA